MTPQICRPVRLLFNGSPIEVAGIDATTSVLAWLRTERLSTGTKEGCAEGDCGACTLVIGELVDDQLRLRTVNACLQLVPMLDGKALFTVEYLRQAGGELHPVQQAMVDHHGSQCGFCTPGFVMSMWNCYAYHEACGTRPERAELAFNLTGNLCRCTGYRPILDAGEAMFELPSVSFDRSTIEAGLRELETGEPLMLMHAGRSYHAPRTLDVLLQLRAENPESTVLAGCTDIGVWINKELRDLGDIVSVSDIAELKHVERLPDRLRIGAGVSLTDAYAAMAEHYPQLDEMWDRFASVPIRNAGTLGGNVANGSPIGDSMPWLIALGAKVELAGRRGTRTLSLENLYVDYGKKAMRSDEVVAAIELPLPYPGLLFRTYKLAKRYDSDISAVCAAFALQLRDQTITQARVAFGGMAAIPRRAAACEAALSNKPWTEATAHDAMRSLGDDFTPLDDVRASADYRLRTARNLVYRCFIETRPDNPLPTCQTRVFHRTPEAL